MKACKLIISNLYKDFYNTNIHCSILSVLKVGYQLYQLEYFLGSKGLGGKKRVMRGISLHPRPHAYILYIPTLGVGDGWGHNTPPSPIIA